MMRRASVRKMASGMVWFYITLLSLCLIHSVCRVLIVERFNIPSESMAPTLVPGDHVWVNKLLFGGRVSKPSFGEPSSELKCFRMPGFRRIHPGDVICFNKPYGSGNADAIRFNPDMVFCKRVLGTPADRIGAVDGHCWNDRVLKPIGVVREQEKLRWMFDSVFIWQKCYDVIPLSMPKWNIKNWGPLVVPAKGLTIILDDFLRELYRQVIEYETGKDLDEALTEYSFREDYYFAVGDNAMDSYDSRYWGFIPEKFIIGIVNTSPK